MKDLTDGQLEALQQRAMEHVKNGTQPSEEDERLSMQHAAARWANEDECPQSVVDGNDLEAVRNLANFSPPVPSGNPDDPSIYRQRYKDGRFFREKVSDGEGN